MSPKTPKQLIDELFKMKGKQNYDYDKPIDKKRVFIRVPELIGPTVWGKPIRQHNETKFLFLYISHPEGVNYEWKDNKQVARHCLKLNALGAVYKVWKIEGSQLVIDSLTKYKNPKITIINNNLVFKDL